MDSAICQHLWNLSSFQWKPLPYILSSYMENQKSPDHQSLGACLPSWDTVWLLSWLAWLQACDENTEDPTPAPPPFPWPRRQSSALDQLHQELYPFDGIQSRNLSGWSYSFQRAFCHKPLQGAKYRMRTHRNW